MQNDIEKDFFERILNLAKRPFAVGLYSEVRIIMRLVCEDCCEGELYADFFSLLGVVCDSKDIPRPMKAALQNLRRKINHLNPNGYQDESLDDPSSEGLVFEGQIVDRETFLKDLRLVAEFVSRAYGVAIPVALAVELPKDYRDTYRYKGASRRQVYPQLRVRVMGVDDDNIIAQTDNDGDVEIMVACGEAVQYGYHTYIPSLVHKGSLLNLLNAREHNGVYEPEWIIFEPDYLMSPSEVAGLFEPYGVSPYNYLIKMFTPQEVTVPIILGNASGVFLDDLIAEVQEERVGTTTYLDSINKVFAQSPIDISLFLSGSEDGKDFHPNAMSQFANIRQLLQDPMSSRFGFNIHEALLEPSFVCPSIGFAGRMDFLQSDGQKLIEQKSGKRDEFRYKHREPHYVQMLIYQMMIEHTMGIPSDKCDAYVLYSRYDDGLMRTDTLKQLLQQAFRVRNEVVSLMERIANGELYQIMKSIRTDDLRIKKVSDKLWDVYVRPRIDKVLNVFGNLPEDDIAMDYVMRYCTFLTKENWYAKMGNPQSGAHGYADLWNNPSVVRVESGEMFANLTIGSLDIEDYRVVGLTLQLPNDENSCQTNFRLGDSVQVYAYDDDTEPNVTHQYSFRAKIADMNATEVRVVLRNPQHQIGLFASSNKRFAIEHDAFDSANAGLYRSLFALLSMPQERRDNFLLTAMPAQGVTPPLYRDYGAFNELVSMERASRDWFLVIGPPGSGKTSCALRYMVEEELRDPSKGRVLLLAYTNRAVDELCGMLEEVIAKSPDLLTDYLRLGHAISAAPQYRERMLCYRVEKTCTTARAVTELLSQTRVVVATTSTMSQQTTLMANLKFSVAFIDEASQILDPYLLPIYTTGSVGRYVLVGDQKQLPAVVMQDKDTSAIHSKSLNSIGIYNCAESLFGRMLHRFMSQGRSDLYYQITTQGRMHPDIYEFVNRWFYGGKLKAVPLKHQKRPLAQVYAEIPSAGQAQDHLLSCIAHNRVIFVDCQPIDDGINDKVNLAEARMVAECIEALSKLYAANDRTLTPNDVGVIVPYRNQISMIRTCLQERGLNIFLDMAIDTVERYQGSQRDVIIYSFTVRHISQLKFLTSSTYIETDGLRSQDYAVDRKLNVALTRSREQLIIIGNKDLLKQVDLYDKMVETCTVQHVD